MAEQAGGAGDAGRHQNPPGNGVSAMTAREFIRTEKHHALAADLKPQEYILDRLGRIILRIAFLFVAAAFLLLTGTQSGIVTLLLIVCLLIFLMEQLSDFWRTKKRLDELQAIMRGLDQRYLFTIALCCRNLIRSAYKKI